MPDNLLGEVGLPLFIELFKTANLGISSTAQLLREHSPNGLDEDSAYAS